MGQLSSHGENYELHYILVICCAFNMELSSEEKYVIERDRVVKIVKEAGEALLYGVVSKIYVEKYKSDLKQWKEEFMNFGAFLKNGVSSDVVVVGESVSLCSSVVSNSGKSSLPVQYLSKPQFSPFFGFSKGEQQHKGVDYRIWRYEVESAVSAGLHSEPVIVEQIHHSLQGEVKSKLVGFGSEASVSTILQSLDQFYSEEGAATGVEILTRAYPMKQGKHEEVSAFASRLDNQLRKAKEKGTELLPDDTTLDWHLRLLFWEGLKPSIKDRARHKKDECKTFGELISAARYGEREVDLLPIPTRVVRSQQVTAEEEKTAKWASEFCAAMAREVQSALASKPTPPSELKPPQGDQYTPPTCFRCGQVGHIQRGCQNTPQTLPSGNANMSLTRGYQGQNTRRPCPNTQNSGQSL